MATFDLQKLADQTFQQAGADNSASNQLQSRLNVPTPKPTAPAQQSVTSFPMEQLNTTPEPMPTFAQEPKRTRMDDEIDIFLSDTIRSQREERQNLLSRYMTAGDNRQSVASIREEAGISEAEQDVLDIREEIQTVKERYRDEEARIRNNEEGKLRGAVNADLADLSRKRSRELADLEVRESIRTGRLESAQAAVKARQEDIENEIKEERERIEKAMEFVGDFTDAEKTLIEKQIDQQMEQKKFNYDKELAKYKEDIKGAAFPFSPSDIISAGGSFYDVLEASGQYDDTLSASERQALTKAVNVAGQLRELSDLVNLDSEQFGPIIGRIRGLNPLDTNAQQFQALIQGIVPNLARGIYGEVGVLTDTDIQNYAQTLPTLQSTEEVQDAMLGMTLKLVRDSVQNQLEVAASNGINVSGNAALLDELDKLVGEALAPINMKSPTVKALIQAGGDKQEIEYLFKQGYSIEAVEDYYLTGGQANAPGDFNNAIAASAQAIADIESGGNYQARGPVVPSGQYAGQQALGKYQIMEGNIGPWSREALGYEITPQQFLANPQLQDQIFAYKFGQAAQQYGTLEDAASVWFSGRPLARAGNAQDVLGTSVPEYVQRFSTNLKKYA